MAPIDEVLSERGLKATPQRLAVHRAVTESIGHPDAHEIWVTVREELPSISLRTVYEVLHTLSDLGVVRELDLATGSSRFDPTISDHHHLVCTTCGAVADVFLDGAPPAVPRRQRHGFEVESHEVTFRGRCRQCSQATTSEQAQHPRPHPRPHPAPPATSDRPDRGEATT